ncbi:MAG: TrkA family potassium uptake protein [Dehalococcoidia bacterium]|nr:TrkA family potassium uptake protein [Dehalococcoidia bacterium]
MTKQVIVVGLGRFGASVAEELYQMGHDVLGIDMEEKNVQDMLGHVTYAVKSDATNEAVLKELGVSNFDVAVVAIGSDVQASILVTVLLKELGIPFIVARAINEIHGNAIGRVGADKVIYPEQETGRRLAHTGFELGVLDYMEVAPNYGITKLRPPDPFVRKTLSEAGLASPRDKYHVAVLAIRRGREYLLVPSRDEEILPGDILIVAASNNEISKVHVSATGGSSRRELGAPDRNGNESLVE